MADTINTTLSKVASELKDTNKRFAQASENAQGTLGIGRANSAVLGSVGGAIKDNLKQSGAGFSAFIDQMEALPVFGAVSKIGKTLGGKFFSKMRQKREDKLLAKQLGISEQEVANRRIEQELIMAEKSKNEELLRAAAALGYSAEQFEKLTNAQQNEGMTAEEVENAREARRDNAKLVTAVEGVSDNLENLEVTQDGESKGMFGGILDSVKGFVPAIGAALTGLGTTIMGGLTALGLKIMLSARSGLGRIGRLFKRIPGVSQLGKVFSKSLVGLKGAGGAVAKTVKAAPKAIAGAAKVGGKVALRGAATAAKFIPGVGLAVTAAMGIFDGMSAGIEEYKKSGKLGTAVKEGIAGAASGLTFGLVSQESISAGMTAIGDAAVKTVDGIKNAATAGFDKAKELTKLGVAKFEELTGLTVPTNLTEVKDAVSNTISSAVSGFNNLTGLSVPENLSELKTAVSDGLSNAAKGFNNLTGLSLPTNLTELKDSVASTFDNIGAGFTNLTGIEVPTFDDLSAKVGAFADNMKENIAKGWEGITNMASDAWGGVKGFFGFGGDDDTEEKNLKQEKIEKIKDQKLANDMEMEEISQRMDKFEKGKNAYRGRDTKKKYNKDEARFNELMAENEGLDQDLSTASITYPTEMQYGFAGDSGGRVFYKYTPDGEIQIAKNQEEASLEYKSPTSSNVTPLDSPRTVEQTSMLQQSNSTAAQIARDYMKNDGNTTVVNAPQNSTVTNMNGGGGGTVIPTVMTDNSSASQAAYANV